MKESFILKKLFDSTSRNVNPTAILVIKLNRN